MSKTTKKITTEEFIKRAKEAHGNKYDFFIPAKNLLIEYNGIQHYKPVDIFGGKKQLKEQRHRDWLKRNYAKKNNYKLLTIPYWNCKIIEEVLEGNLWF